MPVLLHSLGETETGIQNPILHTVPVRLCGDPDEELTDSLGDIVIVGETLHILWSATGVHGDVRQLKLAKQPPHVLTPTADIVHYERADDVERAARDGRPESVNRNPDLRMLRCKNMQGRLKPLPLLFLTDGV